MAEELIAGIVLDAMEDNSKIPHASKIDEISFEELEKNLDIENWNYKSKFKTYIVVDISKFAEKWGKELVKKTVNIPKWVNSKAESLKINFSKTIKTLTVIKHFIVFHYLWAKSYGLHLCEGNGITTLYSVYG